MTQHEKHERDMLRIQRFRLFDDDFLKKCLEEHEECTELILQIIMDKPDLKVTSAKTEYVIQNLQGRSVRFDVKAVDAEQKQYDIEVQRANKGASRKRARHNSSMMDANALAPQEDVNHLSESYVIFITEHDVIGKGEPIYHIERKITETDEFFGDGSHILYVNGTYRGDSKIGKLMHDFSCTDAEDMFYKELADRVKQFKEDEKGGTNMSEIMDEVREEGREEMRQEMTQAMVFRMVNDGRITIEQMANFAGITTEEVKKIMERENILIS